MTRSKLRFLAGLAALALAACGGTEGEDPSAEGSVVNGAIATSEILARAQYWYEHRWDADMTYTWTGYHGDPQGKPYRRDCSGLVSMAWHLDRSYVTYGSDSLANVSRRISKDELQPGDLVMAPWVGDQGHAILFEAWVDSSHTSYWAYEFGSTPVLHHAIKTNGDDLVVGDSRTFYAYRYVRESSGGGTGSTCSVHSDGKLYCTNAAGAAIHASASSSSDVVNHMRSTYSWFDCWGTGERHAGGNTTWYHTLGDDNASWGWMPAADLGTGDAFDANPTAHGLRACSAVPPPPPVASCSVHADGKLYCGNKGGAAVHASAALGSAIVNHLRTTTSWFDCWSTGDLHAGGNTTWYHTLGDDNASWGWVAAVDLSTSSAFDANPGAAGLRQCAPGRPPPASGCGVHGDGKLYCSNVAGAAIHSASRDTFVVDRLRTTYSWFTCWEQGSLHAGGNTTWYYTQGDDSGKWGFVPAVDLGTSSAFDANPSAYGLKACPVFI